MILLKTKLKYLIILIVMLLVTSCCDNENYKGTQIFDTGHIILDPTQEGSFYKLNGEEDLVVEFYVNNKIKWTKEIDIKKANSIGTMDSDKNLYIVGTHAITPNSSKVVFIMKMNQKGDILWKKTIEKISSFFAKIKTDKNNNLYISGVLFKPFNQTLIVDFDPSEEVDEHEAFAFKNLFITKFSSSGDYKWTKLTTGKDIREISPSKMVFDKDNNLYVAGYFRTDSKIDFDPSEKEDFYTPDLPSYEGFITRFSRNGDYEWTKVFQSQSNDFSQSEIYSLAINNDSLYIVGKFSGNVDFDPSEKVDYYRGYGGFLTKLSISGDYKWTKINTNSYFRNLTINNNKLYLYSIKKEVAFIEKFNSDGKKEWTLNGIHSKTMNIINNYMYLTGNFYNRTTDFDITECGEDKKTAGKDGSSFIWKWKID